MSVCDSPSIFGKKGGSLMSSPISKAFSLLAIGPSSGARIQHGKSTFFSKLLLPLFDRTYNLLIGEADWFVPLLAKKCLK